MEKIKILQVIGGLNRGGAETMLMNVLRSINRDLFHFDFLVFDTEQQHYDYEKEVLDMGCKIFRIDAPKLYNPFKFLNDLKKIIVYEKYDCVHSHTLFNSGFVCLAAKFSGVNRIITHSHSTGTMNAETTIYRLYKVISKKIIQIYSDEYLACGEDAGTYLYGKDKFQEKGIIIKNSVDLSVFNCDNDASLSTLANELKIKDSDICIGCVGSFYPVKNHVFLIELCEYAVKSNVNNIHFYFVGKGYLEESLRKEIKNKKLDQFFSFLGTRSDVAQLMKLFDILVMPSLFEGLPVTLIEAQASGLNCIVSDSITKEVDLGLSLIQFASLENKENWLDILRRKSLDNKLSDMSKIKEQFKKNGYFLDDSVKILEEVYSNGK